MRIVLPGFPEADRRGRRVGSLIHGPRLTIKRNCSAMPARASAPARARILHGPNMMVSLSRLDHLTVKPAKSCRERPQARNLQSPRSIGLSSGRIRPSDRARSRIAESGAKILYVHCLFAYHRDKSSLGLAAQHGNGTNFCYLFWNCRSRRHEECCT